MADTRTIGGTPPVHPPTLRTEQHQFPTACPSPPPPGGSRAAPPRSGARTPSGAAPSPRASVGGAPPPHPRGRHGSDSRPAADASRRVGPCPLSTSLAFWPSQPHAPLLPFASGWGAGRGGGTGQTPSVLRAPRSWCLDRRAKPWLSAGVEVAVVVPPPRWGKATPDKVETTRRPPHTTHSGKAPHGWGGGALRGTILLTRGPRRVQKEARPAGIPPPSPQRHLATGSTAPPPLPQRHTATVPEAPWRYTRGTTPKAPCLSHLASLIGRRLAPRRRHQERSASGASTLTPAQAPCAATRCGRALYRSRKHRCGAPNVLVDALLTRPPRWPWRRPLSSVAPTRGPGRDEAVPRGRRLAAPGQ